jgi:hypothetical protein
MIGTSTLLKNQLPIILSAHLSNFVILLQCIFDVGFLNARITEKTRGTSGLRGGERWRKGREEQEEQ